VVQNIETVRAQSQTSGGGAVVGGLIGGLVGHQVDHGARRDLATGVGVVAGAIIGNEVEKNNRTGDETYDRTKEDGVESSVFRLTREGKKIAAEKKDGSKDSEDDGSESDGAEACNGLRMLLRHPQWPFLELSLRQQAWWTRILARSIPP